MKQMDILVALQFAADGTVENVDAALSSEDLRRQISVGDRVTKVNGETMTDRGQLRSTLLSLPESAEVVLTVVRPTLSATNSDRKLDHVLCDGELSSHAATVTPRILSDNDLTESDPEAQKQKADWREKQLQMTRDAVRASFHSMKRQAVSPPAQSVDITAVGTAAVSMSDFGTSDLLAFPDFRKEPAIATPKTVRQTLAGAIQRVKKGRCIVILTNNNKPNRRRSSCSCPTKITFLLWIALSN